VVAAWRVLRWFQPDLVFSTGGFVSVPTVIAATRIAPVLTHEQTAILGLATKIDMRVARVLALSFESTRALAGGFRGRVVVTGNPVRRSVLVGDAARGRERWGVQAGVPIVYVTGGARGASPLNGRLEALLPELLDHCAIVHQTGPATANDDRRRLADARAGWPPHLQRRYQVVDYITDELADTFAAADLVVARAGAGTVAELAALGKPAILIPLPLSGGGEQDVNASVMADAGAAVALPQDEATPERLRAEILAMLQDSNRQTTMSEAAAALARPHAASQLADELLALAAREPSR
jgi:UDP-N-acetylglucosamine--N-acetylmuramyl-(pentapeptide) pyrophosphoryl-undecaprenol N-acetylglucosamine transferase